MMKNMAIGICMTVLLAGTAFAAEAPQDLQSANNQLNTVVTTAASEGAGLVTMSQTTANQGSAVVTIVKNTPEIEKSPVKEAPVKKSQGKKIRINLASRMLTLYEDNTKMAMYPVGAGKVSTPTPCGYYKVIDKTPNPTWTDPSDLENSIASGEDNPLGYRWIGFYGNYGIHGTNRPQSIGGYVSNGCVRMREADVEDLYSQVSMGTPIEIYYDRIVIDKADDHTISYYIYPDGYGRQPLSLDQVNQALAGYGVENFVTYDSIAAKIAASDGNPTYIAKVYTLQLDGKKLALRVLRKGGMTYLPAVAIATSLGLDLEWNSKTETLTSPYGQAPGFVRRDIVYVLDSNAPRLFHVTGGLNKELVYELNRITEPAATK